MYIQAWNPHHLSFVSGLGSSIAMTLWAFLGLESACANSDAVENPEKNIPVAVFGGTLICAVIYILSTNVMAGFVPNLDLANSTAPFGLAFSYMFTPIVGKVIMALMVIACIGSLLGWQFTVAQVFKSSSEVGYFPRIFAKVTSKEAPVVGMLILGVVQTLLSLMTISPSLNKQFNALVNLAVVTNLIPYILSMAALIPMHRLYKVSSKTHTMIMFTALIGTIYSFYALYSSGSEAMLMGSLVTFAGWSFYGFCVRDDNTCPNKSQNT
jgi:putrescine:ornithine antiporter